MFVHHFSVVLNVNQENIVDSMDYVIIFNIQHGAQQVNDNFSYFKLKIFVIYKYNLFMFCCKVAPFQRLMSPLYADGINAPRISVTGRDLPLSRVVSRTLHPDEGFHDHAGTVMVKITIK